MGLNGPQASIPAAYDAMCPFGPRMGQQSSNSEIRTISQKRYGEPKFCRCLHGYYMNYCISHRIGSSIPRSMITNRIYEWARIKPTKPAAISDGRTLTYYDFARAIEAASRFFHGQDLPAGKTAVIVQAATLDAWLSVFALRSIGLSTICIWSFDDIHRLKVKDIGCIVLPNANARAKVTDASVECFKTIVGPSQINASIDAPLANLAQTLPFGGHILLTSGTTGLYKKVFLDGIHEDERNAARGSSYLIASDTMYHIYNFGLWTTIGYRMPSAVWHAGGCVVMDNGPDAARNFFRQPIDLSLLTPSMLNELVAAADDGSPHNDCELLITAGFLPADLAEKAVSRLTRRIGITYGSTELATPALMSRSAIVEDLYWLTPAADRIIRIVDENNEECPPGEEGELQIELLSFDCHSYLDDDEATAKIFRDGFFCPGDLAVRRADELVRVLGRTLDVLKLRERKIAAAPMELAVQHALRVKEVCLFSAMNDIGKTELMVVIETDRAIPRSDLDQVVGMFPAFDLFRFAFFKEFPRTDTGTRKVLRSALRKRVFSSSTE